MDTARGALTLGEAARRLGMDFDALLEMVYSGQVSARLQDETGRLLLSERDLERLQRRLRSGQSG